MAYGICRHVRGAPVLLVMAACLLLTRRADANDAPAHCGRGTLVGFRLRHGDDAIFILCDVP
jgi:hypothetical protein